MRGEGFWLNGRTGTYFTIGEHARWISKPENARKIGLPDELSERACGLDWQRDRLRILLTAMHGGLIRVREHELTITFEFTLAAQQALPAIAEFLNETELAGPQSTLRISDLLRREQLTILYRDFVRQEPGALVKRLHAGRKTMKFIYDEQALDNTIRELQRNYD